MDKFEIPHPFHSDDSFGPHMARTPISQQSNFTFNPKGVTSPLQLSTPQVGKFKWDPDMRLFELEQLSANQNYRNQNPTIKQDLYQEHKEMKKFKVHENRSKKSAAQIKKAPKKRHSKSKATKIKRHPRKKSFQTNLDCFVKMGPTGQQHS